MPLTYKCPFYMWDRRKEIRCECCKVDFHDGTGKQKYADRYCTDLNGWRDCTIAKSLLDYYERTEDDGEKS